MLALPPADPTLNETGGFQILGCTTTLSKPIEQAGIGYEVLRRRIFMVTNDRPLDEDEEEKVDPAKSQKSADKKHNSSNKRRKGRKYSSSSDSEDEKLTQEEKARFNAIMEKKKKQRREQSKAENDRDMVLMQDHYAILGLEDYKIIATEEQIKQAYRKLALDFHPDKKQKKDEEEKDPEEAKKKAEIEKEIWLKIQKANDVLSDELKKKEYDQTLPFDDDIPRQKDITEGNFYELFGPVFQVNSIWSVKKPVPQLGDQETDMRRVKKFYKFWDNFDSWRDFSHKNEYDLDDAEDRYERKWMERENRQARKSYVKAETR